MSLLTIILLSVALAMDCFAVSISQSACFKRPIWSKWIVMSLSFGLFQGLMPLIGYYVMQLFSEVITAYDHWLAFIVLGFLGVRMIVEEFKESDEHGDEKHLCDVNLSYGKIIILAVATSIDALATGVVFVPCPDRLLLGVSSIGLVSFIMSLIGTQIGFNIGKRLSFKWGVLGGVILILIGTKILIEHTCFS